MLFIYLFPYVWHSMVSGHITGAYGCLWCVCSDDQVRMTDACGIHGAYIVWNLLEYTGTASTSLAYVKVICVGVESVLQNCVIERCANLHIHVLLQHPFYRHKQTHRCNNRYKSSPRHSIYFFPNFNPEALSNQKLCSFPVILVTTPYQA